MSPFKRAWETMPSFIEARRLLQLAREANCPELRIARESAEAAEAARIAAVKRPEPKRGWYERAFAARAACIAEAATRSRSSADTMTGTTK